MTTHAQIGDLATRLLQVGLSGRSLHRGDQARVDVGRASASRVAGRTAGLGEVQKAAIAKMVAEARANGLTLPRDLCTWAHYECFEAVKRVASKQEHYVTRGMAVRHGAACALELCESQSVAQTTLAYRVALQFQDWNSEEGTTDEMTKACAGASKALGVGVTGQSWALRVELPAKTALETDSVEAAVRVVVTQTTWPWPAGSTWSAAGHLEQLAVECAAQALDATVQELGRGREVRLSDVVLAAVQIWIVFCIDRDDTGEVEARLFNNVWSAISNLLPSRASEDADGPSSRHTSMGAPVVAGRLRMPRDGGGFTPGPAKAFYGVLVALHKALYDDPLLWSSPLGGVMHEAAEALAAVPASSASDVVLAYFVARGVDGANGVSAAGAAVAKALASWAGGLHSRVQGALRQSALDAVRLVIKGIAWPGPPVQWEEATVTGAVVKLTEAVQYWDKTIPSLPEKRTVTASDAVLVAALVWSGLREGARDGEAVEVWVPAEVRARVPSRSFDMAWTSIWPKGVLPHTGLSAPVVAGRVRGDGPEEGAEEAEAPSSGASASSAPGPREVLAMVTRLVEAINLKGALSPPARMEAVLYGVAMALRAPGPVSAALMVLMCVAAITEASAWPWSKSGVEREWTWLEGRRAAARVWRCWSDADVDITVADYRAAGLSVEKVEKTVAIRTWPEINWDESRSQEALDGATAGLDLRGTRLLAASDVALAVAMAWRVCRDASVADDKVRQRAFEATCAAVPKTVALETVVTHGAARASVVAGRVRGVGPEEVAVWLEKLKAVNDLQPVPGEWTELDGVMRGAAKALAIAPPASVADLVLAYGTARGVMGGTKEEAQTAVAVALASWAGELESRVQAELNETALEVFTRVRAAVKLVTEGTAWPGPKPEGMPRCMNTGSEMAAMALLTAVAKKKKKRSVTAADVVLTAAIVWRACVYYDREREAKLKTVDMPTFLESVLGTRLVEGALAAAVPAVPFEETFASQLHSGGGAPVALARPTRGPEDDVGNLMIQCVQALNQTLIETGSKAMVAFAKSEIQSAARAIVERAPAPDHTLHPVVLALGAVMVRYFASRRVTFGVDVTHDTLRYMLETRPDAAGALQRAVDDALSKIGLGVAIVAACSQIQWPLLPKAKADDPDVGRDLPVVVSAVSLAMRAWCDPDVPNGVPVTAKHIVLGVALAWAIQHTECSAPLESRDEYVRRTVLAALAPPAAVPVPFSAADVASSPLARALCIMLADTNGGTYITFAPEAVRGAVAGLNNVRAHRELTVVDVVLASVAVRLAAALEEFRCEKVLFKQTAAYVENILSADLEAELRDLLSSPGKAEIKAATIVARWRAHASLFTNALSGDVPGSVDGKLRTGITLTVQHVFFSSKESRRPPQTLVNLAFVMAMGWMYGFLLCFEYPPEVEKGRNTVLAQNTSFLCPDDSEKLYATVSEQLKEAARLHSGGGAPVALARPTRGPGNSRNNLRLLANVAASKGAVFEALQHRLRDTGSPTMAAFAVPEMESAANVIVACGGPESVTIPVGAVVVRYCAARRGVLENSAAETTKVLKAMLANGAPARVYDAISGASLSNDGSALKRAALVAALQLLHWPGAPENEAELHADRALKVWPPFAPLTVENVAMVTALVLACAQSECGSRSSSGVRDKYLKQTVGAAFGGRESDVATTRQVIMASALRDALSAVGADEAIITFAPAAVAGADRALTDLAFTVLATREKRGLMLVDVVLASVAVRLVVALQEFRCDPPEVLNAEAYRAVLGMAGKYLEEKGQYVELGRELAGVRDQPLEQVMQVIVDWVNALTGASALQEAERAQISLALPFITGGVTALQQQSKCSPAGIALVAASVWMVGVLTCGAPREDVIASMRAVTAQVLGVVGAFEKHAQKTYPLVR